MLRAMYKTVGFLALAATLAVAAVPASPAYAEAKGTESPFYVSANIPGNQIGNHGYFDLQVQPGDSQTISVNVYNESDETIEVAVEVNNASTALNGLIDYKTPGVQDETMAYPLCDIATLQKDALVIPACGSAIVYVDLEIPTDPFDGIILGGLVFTLVPGEAEDAPAPEPESQQAPEGMKITNIFSSVLAVILQEGDTAAVKPDFEALDVRFETIDFRPVLLHSLRNSEAALVKNMQLEIEVYPEHFEKSVLEETAEVNVAPNSILPYALVFDLQGMAPGSYISHITAVTEENSWTFEVPFVLTEEDLNLAAEVQLEPVPDEPPMYALPLWVIPLIVGLVAVIAVLLFTILRKSRATR